MTRPTDLAVPVDAASVTALIYRSEGSSAERALILAHGAGAGQRSAFMVDFATALASLSIDVVTFNFLYTEQRRRIPDRRPALEACYHAVIAAILENLSSARQSLFIGGKSMGGRIASYIATEGSIRSLNGVVLLGYPLHPPGRQHDRRDAHLPAVHVPMLFVQGSRDAFGTPAELEPVLTTLRHRSELHVVPGGDHSFKIARRDPNAQAAVYDDIQRTIVEWIQRVEPSVRQAEAVSGTIQQPR